MSISGVEMIWHESRPRPDFEDEESEKFISLLSSLDSVGIILSKRDSALSLYLGSAESESHHITGLPDVTSAACDDMGMPSRVIPMRLRNDHIHPLCVTPQTCKIYEQSSLLSDFTFGIIGRRIDPRIIRKRARSFLERIYNKTAPQADMSKPVEWKLEQNSFFVSNVFFACNKEDTPSLLSSINFTNRLSEPNGLVPRYGTKLALDCLPRLPWLGSTRTPVLSIVELASILSLPHSMFGLAMESGAEKTFSNVRGTMEDPARFFSEMFGGADG